MVLRQRSNPIRRQELVFVQHVAEQSLQPFARRNRKQTALLLVGGFHVRDMASQIGPVLDKPVQSTSESGKTANFLVFQNLDRQQRNQANQRSDAKGSALSAHHQLIVVKAVLLIPKTTATQRIYGIRDRDEMFKKLRRDVLVSRFLLRQIDRDTQHRRAIE